MRRHALAQYVPGNLPAETELIRLAAAAGLNAFDDVAALRRLVWMVALRCAEVADSHPGRKGSAGDAIRAVYGLDDVASASEVDDTAFRWPNVIFSK